MKNKEFIEFLKQFSPDSDVFINCHGKLAIKVTTYSFYELDHNYIKLQESAKDE